MEIGTQIEHYVIMDHIGRGGMADVWSAQDTRLKRMVAVKTIGRNLADEADYLARFEHEAHTIAALEHPHILPIYGFGDFDNQLYIIMRYVSGGTLFDRLVNSPLPTDEVMRIANALASALDYAHQRSIVHLDLKPLNVLMDSQGIPYLADFGLAMRTEGGTAHSATSSGSVGYMAPEQMAAEPLDARADVFSFGVMLYQMFTGQMPFGENTMTALMIMTGELLPDPGEKVSGLPARLADVLRRATALNINERPATAGALMDELVNVIESDTSGEAAMFHLDMISMVPADTSPEALAALEAQDIFFRALTAWGQGRGQFVLSMTDFMLVDGYYQPGSELGGALDGDGRQLMLRGAVEYNYDLVLWQAQVTDRHAQREICLHALRSGAPDARARAIGLLVDLPDAEDQPVIVRRVARALGAESDERVRAASVALLEARGAPAGRRRANAWRPAAYTEAIDARLAEEALKTDAPAVAEAAARAIGRVRSTPGVRLLAERGGVGALARARDEAPDLPPGTPWAQRVRIFFALTEYKIDWSALARRFITAAAGGTLGFVAVVFALFANARPEAMFFLDRLFNGVGLGVPSGLLVGLMAVLVVELPERLRDLWVWWVRLPLFWVLGAMAAMVPFTFYHMGFIRDPQPPQDLLLICGAIMAGGFLLGHILRLPPWARALLALVGVSGPLLGAYHLYINGALDRPLMYFGTVTQAQLLSLLLGGTVALGAYLPDLPHRWLALSGGLVAFLGHVLNGLLLGVALRGDIGADGVLLAGLGDLLAFALAGAVVAVLARRTASPRAAGLSALAGGLVYSLIRFITLPPAYAALSPDLHDLAAGLYLAQAVGGPLLAGAVAVWGHCRLWHPARRAPILSEKM
ncbi:MAG: serine/threonine protein kinase [Anaerolineae bacterium]|nr:serine/threonine protein kinase [Anaerolineae bacterium]